MKPTQPSMQKVQAAVEEYCRDHHRFSFDPASPVVRLHEPTFGADEIMAAVECLLTTRVTLGDKVKSFEKEFAGRYGWSHAVMNNSGSSANLLAVAAIANPETKDGLKPGDEVATQGVFLIDSQAQLAGTSSLLFPVGAVAPAAGHQH